MSADQRFAHAGAISLRAAGLARAARPRVERYHIHVLVPLSTQSKTGTPKRVRAIVRGNN
jgi:hypothetical protein